MFKLATCINFETQFVRSILYNLHDTSGDESMAHFGQIIVPREKIELLKLMLFYLKLFLYFEYQLINRY